MLVRVDSVSSLHLVPVTKNNNNRTDIEVSETWESDFFLNGANGNNGMERAVPVVAAAAAAARVWRMLIDRRGPRR